MPEASVKDYWGYYSTMKTANLKGRAEGLAEGLEKGRAEGEKQKGIAIARKMKAKGMPLEDIVEMTGMSLSDIENIGY